MEDSGVVGEYVVGVRGLGSAVDAVLDRAVGSVDLHLHHVALLESVSFLSTLWVFVPIAAVVAQSIT